MININIFLQKTGIDHKPNGAKGLAGLVWWWCCGLLVEPGIKKKNHIVMECHELLPLFNTSTAGFQVQWTTISETFVYSVQLFETIFV